MSELLGFVGVGRMGGPMSSRLLDAGDSLCVFDTNPDAVMVSCPKPTFGEVEPILKTFGKIFFTGEKPGLAQTAKLANNLLAAAAMVVSSEALAMGVKAGLDPQVLLDIINAGSGRNSATQDKFPRSVLPGTFD